MIVDSHCHASRSWSLPIESLMSEMDRAGVLHALLVQMIGHYDNTYILECSRGFPGRFGVIAHINHHETGAARELERLAEQGISGIRFSAAMRSPGEDPLALWRAAQRLGLSITTLGLSTDFVSDAFVKVLEAITDVPIVIEHLGANNSPERDPASLETRRQIFALSRYPNVYMKIHGLGEFSERAFPRAEPFPFIRPVPPLFDLAYDAFGADRLMWGSDFPPVAGREGYLNALRFTQEYFAGTSDEERAAIFGRNALRVFPIPS
ncbi:MAG: amidohydrolase [Chloroflexi bacterium]|nr:amidohydrolase [Chloroflexota bacterium]